MTVASTQIPCTGYSVEIRQGGPEVLDTVSEEWHALCAEAGATEPFYKPEWMTSYVRAFSSDPVVLLAVRDLTGRVVALLPMTAGRARQYGMPITNLIGTANVHSARFDCVCIEGIERESVLRAAWLALRQLPNWDVIQLPYVPDGGTCDALLAIAENEGYLTGRRPSIVSPYLEIPPPPRDIMEVARSSHFRQNLRRRTRNAQSRCKVQLRVETNPTRTALNAFYELEANGWKGRARTAIATDTRTLRFYDAIARVAAKWNALTLYTLTFDDRPVAAHFGITLNNCYYPLKVAYNEDYKEYGPGQLIVAAILRECQRTGIRKFDFLGHEMDWKSEWATKARSHSFLYIFNHTVRAELVHKLKFRVVPEIRGTLKNLSTWIFS